MHAAAVNNYDLRVSYSMRYMYTYAEPPTLTIVESCPVGASVTRRRADAMIHLPIQQMSVHHLNRLFFWRQGGGHHPS